MLEILRIIFGKSWTIYEAAINHEDQLFMKESDLQIQEDNKAAFQKQIKVLQTELDAKKDWPQEVYRDKKKDIELIESKIKKNIDPNMLAICSDINKSRAMVIYLKQHAWRILIKQKRTWIYLLLTALLIYLFR